MCLILESVLEFKTEQFIFSVHRNPCVNFWNKVIKTIIKNCKYNLQSRFYYCTTLLQFSNASQHFSLTIFRCFSQPCMNLMIFTNVMHLISPYQTARVFHSNLPLRLDRLNFEGQLFSERDKIATFEQPCFPIQTALYSIYKSPINPTVDGLTFRRSLWSRARPKIIQASLPESQMSLGFICNSRQIFLSISLEV